MATVSNPLSLFVLIAALGVLGIVVADTIIAVQQAEAGCERGPAVNQAFAKSNGRCFDRGTL